MKSLTILLSFLCLPIVASAHFHRVSAFEMQGFVPAQNSKHLAPIDRQWSCGPNSGARALAMLPEGVCVRFDKDDQHFLEETPATIGRFPTTFIKKAALASFLAVTVPPALYFGISPYTIAWAGLTAFGATTPWWLKSIAPVGPHPAALAEHLQKHTDQYEVKDRRFDTFEEALEAIRVSIVEHDTPAIVHLYFGLFAMHFMTVVGIDSDKGLVELLENNGVSYRTSISWLRTSMTTDVPVLNPLVFGRYNLITFHRTK
jgi:hypothetical protein